MNRISTFRLNRLLVLALLATLTSCASVRAQGDPLPSWNDGPAKQAIVEFVKTTTDGASPKFVPVAERIATFDQDGTLCFEHPSPETRVGNEGSLKWP
jgi:hypothetical protein